MTNIKALALILAVICTLGSVSSSQCTTRLDRGIPQSDDQSAGNHFYSPDDFPQFLAAGLNREPKIYNSSSKWLKFAVAGLPQMGEQSPWTRVALSGVKFQEMNLALPSITGSSIVSVDTSSGSSASEHDAVLEWSAKAKLAANRSDAAEMIVDADHIASIGQDDPKAQSLAANTYSDSAEIVRKSRFYSDMTDHEAAFVDAAYDKWVAAAKRWTILSPKDSEAWSELSQAATFAGDSSARSAFWNAISMHPIDPGAYSWGLQMFQAKWGGSLSDMQRLSRVILTDTSQQSADLASYASDLTDDRDKAIRNDFFDAAIAYAQKSVVSAHKTLLSAEARKDAFQTNSWKHIEAGWNCEIGDVYDQEGDYIRAIPARKQALALTDDPYAHWALGRDYRNSRQYSKAIHEYRVAIDESPANASFDRGLALSYSGAKRYAEAEASALKAISIDHGERSQQALGLVYYSEGKFSKAYAAFSAAYSFSQYAPLLFLEGEALAGEHQYKAAIVDMTESLPYAFFSTDVQTSILPASYLALNDDRGAIQSASKVLGYNPHDENTWIVLAKAYQASGSVGNAEATLQAAIEEMHDPTAVAFLNRLASSPAHKHR